MKLTLEWLKIHTEVEEKNTTKLIHYIGNTLQYQGAELEKTEFVNPIIVGKILTITQPKNMHIKLCRIAVKTGGQPEGFLNILCGSDNIYEGMYVFVAPAGTRIINNLLITKRTINNVTSEGMLLSADELGHVPTGAINHKDGVMEATKEFYGTYSYDDIIFTIEVPHNRWDLKSVKYLAHNLKLGPIKPTIDPIYNEEITPIDIEVSDNAKMLACGFMMVKNMKLSTRVDILLKRIGKHSESPAQRLNDFILLDTGHPINIIDCDSIDRKLYVHRDLSTNSYILRDDSKIISQMGQKTLVGYEDKSTSFLIEVSYLLPENIPCSDGVSAPLFLAGIDPQQNTMDQIANLLCGSDIYTPLYLGSRSKQTTNIIITKQDYLTRTGQDKSLEDMANILVDNNFKVTYNDNSIEVTIPSWKTHIKSLNNLIEEIARSVHIETINPLNFNYPSILSNKEQEINNISYLFTALGFEQLCTYPAIGKADHPDAIKINNPMNANGNYLRTKLSTTLIRAARTRSKEHKTIKIFEFGKVYTGNLEELRFAFLLGGNSEHNLLFQGKPYDGIFLKYYLNLIKDQVEVVHYGKSSSYYFAEGRLRLSPPKEQDDRDKGFHVSFYSNKPVIWKDIAALTKCKFILFDRLEIDGKFSYSAKLYSSKQIELDQLTNKLIDLNMQLR